MIIVSVSHILVFWTKSYSEFNVQKSVTYLVDKWYFTCVIVIQIHKYTWLFPAMLLHLLKWKPWIHISRSSLQRYKDFCEQKWKEVRKTCIHTLFQGNEISNNSKWVGHLICKVLCSGVCVSMCLYVSVSVCLCICFLSSHTGNSSSSWTVVEVFVLMSGIIIPWW